MKLTSIYEQALEDALMMMNEWDELEPTSALKASASEYGIAWGEDMGKFVEWARKEMRAL
jgi:hypothetical protein